MLTPFGDLPPGTHDVGDVIVTVSAHGWTETPKESSPRMLWPYEFQALLTDDQLAAIYTSTIPAVIRMATKVQTIISPMPFDQASDLYLGVQALGLLMPEQFTPSEVTRILAAQPPTE